MSTMTPIDSDITPGNAANAKDAPRDRDNDRRERLDGAPSRTAGNATRTEKTARQRWMGLLARSDGATLEAAWNALDGAPDYSFLRPAEVGMVMVRGRAGGTGRRFNLGEMTVCRCSVRTAQDLVGHAYVAGRDKRHAHYAALFDALLQEPAWRARLEGGILGDIETQENTRVRNLARKTAATKVDFFTLVRGADAQGDDRP